MKQLLLAFALGTAVGLSVACDSDNGDSLTLEQYVVAVGCLTEEAAFTATEYWDELNARTTEGEPPEPTSAQAVRGANLAFFDELAELEPPDEIRNAHEQIIDSGRESARLLFTERPRGVEDVAARFEDARNNIDEAMERAGIQLAFLSGSSCRQDEATPTP